MPAATKAGKRQTKAKAPKKQASPKKKQKAAAAKATTPQENPQVKKGFGWQSEAEKAAAAANQAAAAAAQAAKKAAAGPQFVPSKKVIAESSFCKSPFGIYPVDLSGLDVGSTIKAELSVYTVLQPAYGSVRYRQVFYYILMPTYAQTVEIRERAKKIAEDIIMLRVDAHRLLIEQGAALQKEEREEEEEEEEENEDHVGVDWLFGISESEED